jgi:hypothetical protein
MEDYKFIKKLGAGGQGATHQVRRLPPPPSHLAGPWRAAVALFGLTRGARAGRIVRAHGRRGARPTGKCL